MPTSYTAPGHILQNEALWGLIKDKPPGKFLDVGCGVGVVSHFLLSKGWTGFGVDLNREALKINAAVNKNSIDSGNYYCEQVDFLDEESRNFSGFDLVISVNVIEHLEEQFLSEFLANCQGALSENGTLVIISPGSPKDWGIEDEVCGHVKRYSLKDFDSLGERAGLKVQRVIGATWPLSNILLGISNHIVRRSESQNLKMSRELRTLKSSVRNTEWKTEFPGWTKIIVNKLVLYPFILLQTLFWWHPRSLAIVGVFSKSDKTKIA